MVYTGRIAERQRLVAGSGALLVAIAVGLGLANSLDLHVIRTASEAISAIALPAAERPKDQPISSPEANERAAGKASAANEHAKAAAVVAPKPNLRLPQPQVVAAPIPAEGTDPFAGATPDPGSGSGAGGRGDGTGAGGSGNGAGGGTKAAWRSGAIRDRDYPRDASSATIGGDVEVRFTIEATGRVTGCRVSRSSGHASLDATTCRLIEERFRFKPATNPAGEPIASQYGWRQSWWLERRK